MSNTIPTIDLDELATVTGGGILGVLGRSLLSGALQGAAAGVQSPEAGKGAVWKGLLSGGLQGLANGASSLIKGAGAPAPGAAH